VLSWNIQFAGSRDLHFFYDGGDAVHVPPPVVDRTLAGIAAHVREADLALIQEIDRGARRTNFVDELPALAAGFPAWASACYHRVRWLPHPTRVPLGRVEFHLAALSRFAMRDARRVQLPRMNEPRWRRALNIKRCLLDAELPIEGGGALSVAVTHLSAFTKGDDTLVRQVAAVAEWMESRPKPWILAGDFNLLPPGDDPARLPDAVEYSHETNPMERLIPRFRSALPPDAYTYQPFGGRPDRVLDYVFVSDDVEVLSAEAAPSDLSDHLPLRVRVRV
jgi:endonuclease/exonuclease/phosphatase family metal-dependent hydrolase